MWMDYEIEFRKILPFLKALDNLVKQYRTDDSYKEEMLSVYRQNKNDNFL